MSYRGSVFLDLNKNCAPMFVGCTALFDVLWALVCVTMWEWWANACCKPWAPQVSRCFVFARTYMFGLPKLEYLIVRLPHRLCDDISEINRWVRCWVRVMRCCQQVEQAVCVWVVRPLHDWRVPDFDCTRCPLLSDLVFHLLAPTCRVRFAFPALRAELAAVLAGLVRAQLAWVHLRCLLTAARATTSHMVLLLRVNVDRCWVAVRYVKRESLRDAFGHPDTRVDRRTLLHYAVNEGYRGVLDGHGVRLFSWFSSRA